MIKKMVIFSLMAAFFCVLIPDSEATPDKDWGDQIILTLNFSEGVLLNDPQSILKLMPPGSTIQQARELQQHCWQGLPIAKLSAAMKLSPEHTAWVLAKSMEYTYSYSLCEKQITLPDGKVYALKEVYPAITDYIGIVFCHALKYTFRQDGKYYVHIPGKEALADIDLSSKKAVVEIWIKALAAKDAKTLLQLMYPSDRADLIRSCESLDEAEKTIQFRIDSWYSGEVEKLIKNPAQFKEFMQYMQEWMIDSDLDMRNVLDQWYITLM